MKAIQRQTDRQRERERERESAAAEHTCIDSYHGRYLAACPRVLMHVRCTIAFSGVFLLSV